MAKFLSSDKIKVFPTAFRGKDANGKVIDPNAFLTTEENIVNIANKVLYKGKNYLFDEGNTIHLILGGYYFVFNKNDIEALFTSGESDSVIYAGIIVNDLSQSYESYTTKTLTPNGGSAGEVLDIVTGTVQEFKGLSFVLSTDPAIEVFTYKLPLFKRTRNGWKVIDGSRLNLSTQQIADGSISEDGTSSSINEAFTTNELNVNVVHTDRVDLRDTDGVILPKFSSNRCAIGTSTNQFNSGYFKNLNVSSIYGVSNINTNNLNVYASSSVTIGASSRVTLYGETFETECLNRSDVATVYSINTSTYTLIASSRATLSVSGVLDLSASNTHAYISASGFDLRTDANFSLSTNSFYVYSPSYMGFETSTFNMNFLDRALRFGNGSMTCVFDFSSGYTTKFEARYPNATFEINNFSSISLNSYPIRPFEHRMMLQCEQSQTSYNNYAFIVTNPKFFTSQNISTKSEFIACLNSASYFVNNVVSGTVINSPLVATGKLRRYEGTDYKIYDIVGIGMGTVGTSTTLNCLCYDGNNYIPYTIIDLGSYGFTVINDLV